jgi:hypothetical protein
MGINQESAKASMDALVCAIKAVYRGNYNACPGIIFGDEMVQILDEYNPPINSPLEGAAVEGVDKSKTQTGIQPPAVSCKPGSGSDLECTVSNFNLPQKIEEPSISERILEFGSPDFLVYYQGFPLEEDTWSYKLDWKITAAIIVLSAVPATKVGGTVTRTVFKRLFPKAAEKLRASVVTRESRAWVIKQLASDFAQTMAKRIKKHYFRVAIRGVVFSSYYNYLDIAEEQAKDAMERLETVSNSFVLKSPYTNRVMETLDIGMVGWPVVVVRDVTGPKKLGPAHFVSPCYINSMKVRKQDIKCEQYVFSEKEKTVACEVIDLNPGLGDPSCKISTFSTYINHPSLSNINTIMQTPIVDLIKSIRSDYTVWEASTGEAIDNEMVSRYGEYYMSWKKLNCSEWRKSISTTPLGGTVTADDGTVWYKWGSTQSIGSLWVNRDVCGGKSIVSDPGVVSSGQFGKCEGDEPGARKEEILNEYTKGSDLSDMCLSYNPTGKVGDGIPKNIMVAKDERNLALTDKDEDGFFDSYSLKDCRTPALVISEIAKAGVGENEYNYCFDERGLWEDVLKAGGTIIGATGIVVGAVMSAPVAIAVGSILGAGTQIAGEYGDWEGQWPGEKGFKGSSPLSTVKSGNIPGDQDISPETLAGSSRKDNVDYGPAQ